MRKGTLITRKKLFLLVLLLAILMTSSVLPSSFMPGEITVEAASKKNVAKKKSTKKSKKKTNNKSKNKSKKKNTKKPKKKASKVKKSQPFKITNVEYTVEYKEVDKMIREHFNIPDHVRTYDTVKVTVKNNSDVKVVLTPFMLLGVKAYSYRHEYVPSTSIRANEDGPGKVTGETLISKFTECQYDGYAASRPWHKYNTKFFVPKKSTRTIVFHVGAYCNMEEKSFQKKHQNGMGYYCVSVLNQKEVGLMRLCPYGKGRNGKSYSTYFYQIKPYENGLKVQNSKSKLARKWSREFSEAFHKDWEYWW